MDRTFDIIIIGGGPAGYSAALYAARGGMDTLLIEKMAPGGQMTLTGDIDNYPGYDDGIDGFTLGMKMQAGAERFGATTEYAEVISVDFGSEIKRIKTNTGELCARAIIVAVGANPGELGVRGEKEYLGNGVHYCAHCDGRFYKDQTVAVVGGGNSAVTDAIYLSKLVNKLYLIHRRAELRATKVYHDVLFNCGNVEFLWNSTVESISMEEDDKHINVKSVLDNSISRVPCDGVFISIGRRPATDIFKGLLKLDKNGYIIADETTRTNIEGVFAAGDVRTKELRQVVTAASDGAVAAHYAMEYISQYFNK